MTEMTYSRLLEVLEEASDGARQMARAKGAGPESLALNALATQMGLAALTVRGMRSVFLAPAGVHMPGVGTAPTDGA